MDTRNFCVSLMAFVAMAMSGCGDDATRVEQDPAAIHAALTPQANNRVATVSYPLQYLTQCIVGDAIAVDFTTGHRPSDQNWQPSENDVAILQQADLVIVNGPAAVYADWLSRVSVSDSKICNSCIDLATKDFILVDDYKIVHQHGPDGEHTHPYMVAYSWLDPAIARKQARKILKDLSRIYPDKAIEFETNLKALERDLDELSTALADVGRNGEAKVVSINPFFKFLTRAANVEDHHLLWFGAEDDGTRKEQLEKKLAEVRGEKQNPVVLIIPNDGDYDLEKSLGPEFESEFKVKTCYLNTFDRSPDSGDYLSEMQKNIETLNTAVNQRAAQQ